MKYWDDFASQYGFDDGEEMPADAEPVRKACIRVMNALLQKYGSSCRCHAYNPSGLHNTLRILTVQYDPSFMSSAYDFTLPDIHRGPLKTVPTPDDAYRRALAEARQLRLGNVSSSDPDKRCNMTQLYTAEHALRHVTEPTQEG